MPAKWFLCPDGETIECLQCTTKCRMERRCMTIPTALYFGQTRPLPKIPRVSASQGANGVRLIYLRMTQPYIVDPQKSVALLLGTVVHHQLEKGASGDRFLSEQYFKNDYTSGIIDLYERPTKTLYDYKTYGAFALRKALGLEKSVVPDPSGAVYKRDCKSGKKGDPRMIEVWTENPEKADRRGLELQLNCCRILIQELYPVEHMTAQVLAKEPPWFLKQNGIDRPLHIFDIARLPDDEVIEVFKTKTEELRHAFRTGEVPDYCTLSERWENKRCDNHCDVASVCNPPWLQEKVTQEDLDGIVF